MRKRFTYLQLCIRRANSICSFAFGGVFMCACVLPRQRAAVVRFEVFTVVTIEECRLQGCHAV
jgi:hypothetical protein